MNNEQLQELFFDDDRFKPLLTINYDRKHWEIEEFRIGKIELDDYDEEDEDEDEGEDNDVKYEGVVVICFDSNDSIYSDAILNVEEFKAKLKEIAEYANSERGFKLNTKKFIKAKAEEFDHLFVQ